MKISFIFLLLSQVLAFAEPKLFYESQECNSRLDSSAIKKLATIDDSLHDRWKNGLFIYYDSIGELPGLCGCACDDGPGPCCYDDVISISSSHDIGDSIWLLENCGTQDSVVKISDNWDYGPAFTKLQENSPLWNLIRDFKSLVKKLKRKDGK